MIYSELILLGLDVPNAEQAIRHLGARMTEYGYVRETFVDAVIEREKTFPTGLPTPIPVAIPHTDAVHCCQPAIAVGVLTRPVTFGEMGNPQGKVDAKAIFLLSITDPSQQVIWLQKLVEAFHRPHFLQRLVTSRNTEEARSICEEALTQ